MVGTPESLIMPKPDETTGVKHIKAKCPIGKCTEGAFVQVLTFKDGETQKKVDRKARLKLKKQLTAWHEEGLHDN